MCWTDKTYNQKLDKLSALKKQRSALDAEIKELENAIKTDLGDSEEKNTKKYIIRYTKYNSPHFDSKSFGKIHPKLLQEFTKITPARKFTFDLIKKPATA